MLILGIDTCCMSATAALVNDDTMVAETVINHHRTHSQMMLPQIEEMLRLAEIAPRDIDAFAAAVGPGSFTGVRIGIATAKALAQASEKPCIAVSTLEALAFGSALFDGIVSPILDARRGQVYNALFEGGKDGLKRLCEDRALALDELLNEFAVRDGNVIFMGDGVPVCKEKITDVLGERAVFAPKITALNLGGSVAEIGLKRFYEGKSIHYSKLIPEYVRLSQAEQDKLRQNTVKAKR